MPRLRRGEIALISHRDLDLMAAQDLARRGVSAVLNDQAFSSGRYPNLGPRYLLDRGVKLYPLVPKELWRLGDGSRCRLDSDHVLHAGGSRFQLPPPLDAADVEQAATRARANLLDELDKFIDNTLRYAKHEKGLVLDALALPALKTEICGRPVVVVVRGPDYRQDLRAICHYIRENRPVLMGVDGGGDALLEQGLIPDLVVGDMDSVSDRALKLARELVVHAYPDGRAPGMARLAQLGLGARVLAAPGTSEDVAMLLAAGKGADLLVAVGTHSSMIDFLEKGRPGMASTFLTRLKVGDRLVDAKGLSKLYQGRMTFSWALALFASAALPMVALIYGSEGFRHLARLMWFKLRSVAGG